MQIITHNMGAANTSRQLGIISDGKSKASEKLSSGYRINRSADDAAGLTISEKMRRQIRGLKKASTNIQDGISMVQTAEGALNEVHDMLQRMNEIATQAASDPNTDADREALQSEMYQIRSEINRVSRTTQFNTHTVLMARQLVEIDTEDYAKSIMEDEFYGMGSRGNNRAVYGKKLSFANVNENNKEELIDKSFWVTCSEQCGQIFSFKFTDADQSSVKIQGEDLMIEIGMKNAALKNGKDVVAEIYGLIVSKQTDFANALHTTRPSWSNTWNDTVIGHANGISIDGASMIFYSTTKTTPSYLPGMGLIMADDLMRFEEEFRIQSNDNPYQEIGIMVRTINAATLGLDDLSIGSFEKAGKTMETVQNAIESVSEYRSYLGAVQNRLEKAVLIVDNTAENTQSAESKLRDADMAEEMLSFSKANILEQVAQSMLAHTNQDTDSVLRLLA